MELACIVDFALNNTEFYTLVLFDRKKVVLIRAYIPYEEYCPCDIENVLSYYTTGTIDYFSIDHYLKILPDTESFKILKSSLNALPNVIFPGQEKTDEETT